MNFLCKSATFGGKGYYAADGTRKINFDNSGKIVSEWTET